MKPRALLFASLGLLLALPLSAAEPAKPATQFADRMLRFPPGAAQLSYLNIEPAVESPVPVLEPQNGRLTYNDDLTARVFTPVDGRVVQIVAKPGDSVRPGDPLAWLDAPDYIQALADLNDARVRLRQKTLERDRAAALFKGEVIARKDFEAAVFEFEHAKEELRRAEARFAHLNPTQDVKQNRFALRAPIQGVVTERKILPGTEVDNAKTEPLFVITDPTRLWVSFELAEKDIGKLHLGQPVMVSVEAYPGQGFPARIDFISDVVDPTTRRVVVRSSIDNPERRLKPEMYAKVTPLAEGQSLPRVPNTALVTEGVKTFLFVEREPGVIEKRAVRLAFRGPSLAWVSEGLKMGERVVTTGAVLLNAELSGQ